jgi:hypothetical protein
LCRLEQKKKQLAVSDLLAEAGEHFEFRAYIHSHFMGVEAS